MGSKRMFCKNRMDYLVPMIVTRRIEKGWGEFDLRGHLRLRRNQQHLGSRCSDLALRGRWTKHPCLAYLQNLMLLESRKW